VKTVYSKAAGRALLRCNKRSLVREKIEAFVLEADPMAANVIRLQGREEYRLRVQDWRVIFRIDGDLMLVDEIAPRGSAYEVRK
jgi:mRNA interferase RelE/StbE